MVQGNTSQSSSHHSITLEDTQASAAASATTTLKVAPAEAAAAPMHKNPWSPSSATASTMSKRLCRICQSDSGLMVRPCDCAGTMGDIHEDCLSRWVGMSNKQQCEICKQSYAKSGARFKRFANWARPKLDFYDIAGIFILLSLMFSIYYVIDLMRERQFWTRLAQDRIPCRSDDAGRLALLLILLLAILNNAVTMYMDVRNYLRLQTTIRFINKH